MKKGTEKRKDLMNTLRSLKGEELTNRIRDEREKLFWERFKKRTQPGEKVVSLKKAKKNYARLLTIQHEKGRLEVKS
jgi:ribosomal protein L29